MPGCILEISMTVASVWKSIISRHSVLSSGLPCLFECAKGVITVSSLEDGEDGTSEEINSGTGGRCNNVGRSVIVLITPSALR